MPEYKVLSDLLPGGTYDYRFGKIYILPEQEWPEEWTEAQNWLGRDSPKIPDDKGVAYTAWDSLSSGRASIYLRSSGLSIWHWGLSLISPPDYTCHDCGASIGPVFNHYLCKKCREKQWVN